MSPRACDKSLGTPIAIAVSSTFVTIVRSMQDCCLLGGGWRHPSIHPGRRREESFYLFFSLWTPTLAEKRREGGFVHFLLPTARGRWYYCARYICAVLSRRRIYILHCLFFFGSECVVGTEVRDPKEDAVFFIIISRVGIWIRVYRSSQERNCRHIICMDCVADAVWFEIRFACKRKLLFDAQYEGRNGGTREGGTEEDAENEGWVIVIILLLLRYVCVIESL
jgi:hypothetical protein